MKSVTGLLFLSLPWVVSFKSTVSAQISNSTITLEFDGLMHSRAVSHFGGVETVLGPMQESEVLLVNNKEVNGVALDTQRQSSVQSAIGMAQRLTLQGHSQAIQKIETIDAYASYPTMLFLNVEYRNVGHDDLKVDGSMFGTS